MCQAPDHAGLYSDTGCVSESYTSAAAVSAIDTPPPPSTPRIDAQQDDWTQTAAGQQPDSAPDSRTRMVPAGQPDSDGAGPDSRTRMVPCRTAGLGWCRPDSRTRMVPDRTAGLGWCRTGQQDSDGAGPDSRTRMVPDRTAGLGWCRTGQHRLG